MQKINILTTGVLILLIMALLGGEVYYLFFYQPGTKPTQTALSTPTSTLSLPTNTALPKPKIQGQTRQGSSTLERLKNSALVSSTFTYQFEGEIIEIDRKGGIASEMNNLKYKTKLTIKGKGDNPSNIYFGENMLNITKVMQISNEKEAPIRFSDLKIGNTVSVKLIFGFNDMEGNYSIPLESTIKRI